MCSVIRYCGLQLDVWGLGLERNNERERSAGRLRVSGFGFRAWDMRLRDWSLRVGVLECALGFRGFKVRGSGLRVWSSGFGVQGVRLRGLEFRVCSAIAECPVA